MWNDQCDKDDEECGRHSGIPPCCRAWFINVWRKIMFDDIEYELEPEENFWIIDYVRCPGCRSTGAYVKIKECPINERVGGQ
jgi:hypothetical protein